MTREQIIESYLRELSSLAYAHALTTQDDGDSSRRLRARFLFRAVMKIDKHRKLIARTIAEFENKPKPTEQETP